MPLDVVGLGQTVMDRIVRVTNMPGSGKHCEAISELELGGGMTANVTVAFARLGLRAGLIAAVGDDPMGDRIRQDLAAEGVETRGMVVRAGARSPHWLMFLDPHGRRSAVLFNGATMQGLRPDEVNPELFEGARVYFTDIYAPAAAAHAARLAHAAGAAIAADMQATLASYESFGNLERYIWEVLDIADFFLPSVGGLTTLMREPDMRDAMRKLMVRYPRLVIAQTLGEQGSLVGAGGELIAVPSFAVDVVDTLGAGDAYHAAFVYGSVFRRWAPDRAARFASAAAAIKCTRVGARSAPALAEIEAFLVARS
jgi:sugar/nucleoside kinase (ribokinase family)